MGKQPGVAAAKIEKSESDHLSSSPQLNHRSETANRAAAKLEPQPPAGENRWTIEKSEELYRIQGWGEPYFSINAAGHVTVSPQGDRGGSLDLY